MSDPGNIHNLRNIGPKSAAWLAVLGIHTRAELEAFGVVNAYRVLTAEGYNTSLNLLWALYGAVHDIDWRDIPPDVKARLKAEAGR